MKYLLPPINSTDIGPQTSLWMSSIFVVECVSWLDLNDLLCIFPSIHPSQKDSLEDLGIFISEVNSLSTSSFRCCSSKWPRRWCHRSIWLPCSNANDMCSAGRGLQSNRYSLSLSDPIPHNFHFSFLIQHLVRLNFAKFPLTAAALTENKLHPAWKHTTHYAWQLSLAYWPWMSD